MTYSIGDTFKELLKSETLQSLLKYFTSGRFIISIIAIILAVGLVITVSKVTRYYLKKQREINGSHLGQEKVTMLHVMASVITSIIIVITVIFILQINGLEVSSLQAAEGEVQQGVKENRNRRSLTASGFEGAASISHQ